jgi:hypothetical protein
LKHSVQTVTVVTLTLSKAEAEWLRGLVQNNLYQTLDDEPMRHEMFTLLDAALRPGVTSQHSVHTLGEGE